MKQIKIFEGFDEEKINSFLKESNGVIVSYSPNIIIEYDYVDSLGTPTIVLSGAPIRATFYRTYSDFDYSEDIIFNKVLCFGERLVFLINTQTTATYNFINDTVNIKGDVNHINCFSISEREVNLYRVETVNEVIELLQRVGELYPEETHITYNHRTEAINNIANSIDKHGKNTKSGLLDISESIVNSAILKTNSDKKIYNAKTLNKRVL